MYVVMHKLQIKPDARESVAKTFESKLGHLQAVPGFHAFQLLQSEEDDGTLVAMVLWDAKASYETHVASAAAKEIHSGPEAEAAHAAMTGPPTREAYTVLHMKHASHD